ncbi:hypothetical protein Tco_1559239, partial [Tanacetum coccineum]
MAVSVGEYRGGDVGGSEGVAWDGVEVVGGAGSWWQEKGLRRRKI